MVLYPLVLAVSVALFLTAIPSSAAPAPATRPAPRPAPPRPAAQPSTPPSDFSGLWVRDDPDGSYMPPVSGPGPMMNDPKNARFGDISNPILKPWAAAVVEKNGRAALAGTDVHNPTYAMCRPAGVPLVAAPLARMRILQPDKGRAVTFLYEYDSQARRVYLTETHSARLTPSWFGESIGHYEGDTLIVDTIGQNQKTDVDRFGTPHTGALHVVERYRLIGGGERLENTFTVEDEKTFAMPWTAVVHWKRDTGAWEEISCAVNTKSGEGGNLAPDAERSPF
jgi:hypothetical protein